ncbi:MAG TPA: OmpA family protein [Pyrinomonadaceae bacterium]|nr:OmpA family protein [Pyrinomonadaceae bacterium]
MYIVEGRGFGEPLREPWRVRVGLQSKPPQLLRFLSLDNFGFDKSTVTSAQLKQIKEILVPTVDASWKTMQPINFIRVVGHTDSTGSEKYNFGLGDRRAEAVAAELLKIYPRSGRVKIILEKSPGETQPTGDNRTAVGQARNRRVEIFIGMQPPPEPPKKPICLTCVPPPPDKPRDIFKPIPPARPGMSFKQRVEELCAKVLPKSACPTVVDKILGGGCQLLEMLLEQAGATMSAKQKEDLRKECLAAAKKPR